VQVDQGVGDVVELALAGDEATYRFGQKRTVFEIR